MARWGGGHRPPVDRCERSPVESGATRGRHDSGWFDADTGDVQWVDLPTQIGAASWLESNEIGDLIVGGTTGVALYRTPGGAPTWISRDRALHTNRILDGIELTSRILQTTNLNYDREGFSLQTGRKLDLDTLPEDALRTGMPTIRRHGDSQSLLFDKMILILDSGGVVTDRMQATVPSIIDWMRRSPFRMELSCSTRSTPDSIRPPDDPRLATSTRSRSSLPTEKGLRFLTYFLSIVEFAPGVR